jgi:NitT/TauT family transport system substrate-binding protein
LSLRILLSPILALGIAFGAAPAAADSKVKVGVLQFGTVSWVLDTIQHNGLDKAEGIELEIVPLASNHATQVAVQSGSVNIIATDWLWVSRQRTEGAEFTFAPFTTALGAIMVPPETKIQTLLDLKDRRIGIAGGPIDKSWLLIAAYAQRVANIDLRTETRQDYGAPPLLAEKARSRELDAVLQFWPYAARLEAQDFKELIGINDVVLELGARGPVSMVGFVFNENWAKANPQAIAGFLRAVEEANAILAASDDEWERIRPMMKVEDDVTFEAMKRRYREGIPNRDTKENETDAAVLYDFLRDLGGDRLVGKGKVLAPGTFWHGSAS